MTCTHRLRSDGVRYLCGRRVTDGTRRANGPPTCSQCTAAMARAEDATERLRELGRQIGGASNGAPSTRRRKAKTRAALRAKLTTAQRSRKPLDNRKRST